MSVALRSQSSDLRSFLRNQGRREDAQIVKMTATRSLVKMTATRSLRLRKQQPRYRRQRAVRTTISTFAASAAEGGCSSVAMCARTPTTLRAWVAMRHQRTRTRNRRGGAPRVSVFPRQQRSTGPALASTAATSPHAQPLQPGVRVWAKYLASDPAMRRRYGPTRWYMGTIHASNADGTYAVAYDDGDFEASVLPKYIRHSPQAIQDASGTGEGLAAMVAEADRREPAGGGGSGGVCGGRRQRHGRSASTGSGHSSNMGRAGLVRGASTTSV